MVIELAAGSTKLVIACDWCDVVLHSGGVHPLGAETRGVIVERLLRGLQGDAPEPNAGEIEGVGVGWVLSLAERHSSIYAADRERLRLLFFQDADGKLIVRIDLSSDDRKDWVRILGGL
jgi:hypothetical protein